LLLVASTPKTYVIGKESQIGLGKIFRRFFSGSLGERFRDRAFYHQINATPLASHPHSRHEDNHQQKRANQNGSHD